MVLGSGKIKTHTSNSIFRTHCEFVPTKEAEPEQYEDEEKDDGVIIRQPKCSYLPGERLLQKINKDKKKRRAKASSRRANNLMDPDDVGQISASMSRLVSQLS